MTSLFVDLCEVPPLPHISYDRVRRVKSHDQRGKTLYVKHLFFLRGRQANTCKQHKPLYSAHVYIYEFENINEQITCIIENILLYIMQRNKGLTLV